MTRIIPRAEWGARYGRGSDVSGNLPWGEVVGHTEAVNRSPTSTPETEAQWVRGVERYHAQERGWTGIGYSFLIGPSGAIFEGRGWGRSGAHTESRNSTAAGVCFLGHGDNQPATESQWASAQWLIGEGIRLGKLKSNPKITGHRNYSLKGKSCPGDLIYPHLDRLRGVTSSSKPTPSKPSPPPPPKEDPIMAALTTDQVVASIKAGTSAAQAADMRSAALVAELVEPIDRTDPKRPTSRQDRLIRIVLDQLKVTDTLVDMVAKLAAQQGQDFAAQLTAIAEARVTDAKVDAVLAKGDGPTAAQILQ